MESSIRIIWNGRNKLFDSKISIFVNGNLYGKYSYKGKFDIIIPVTPGTVNLKCAMDKFNQVNLTKTIEPNNNYTYILRINNFGKWCLDSNDEIPPKNANNNWWKILLLLIPIVIIFGIFQCENKGKKENPPHPVIYPISPQITQEEYQSQPVKQEVPCTFCNSTGLVLKSYKCPAEDFHDCTDVFCTVCGNNHCMSNNIHMLCPNCNGRKTVPSDY